MSPTPADHRKQRNVVASNSNNNRVVDERGYAVPDVELQEAFPRIDDSFRRAAKSVVRLDRFKCLSKADLSSDDNDVRFTDETRPCVCVSLFECCCDPLIGQSFRRSGPESTRSLVHLHIMPLPLQVKHGMVFWEELSTPHYTIIPKSPMRT